MAICSNILFLRILSYFETCLQIVRFVVPIGLVIMIAFDFYKNMMLNDQDKQKENVNKAIRRIVAGIIVFLVPTMVNLFMFFVEETIGETSDYKSCLSDIENIDFYIELSNKEKELASLEEKEKLLKEYEGYKQDAINLIKRNLSRDTSSNNSMAISMGNKYNLSESELIDLAKVCQSEQPGATGAAWEASLMANRYELYGQSYGSLYNYVMKSGWWGPVIRGSYKNINLAGDVLNSVRQVLVYGQRSIPLYIDEHDYVGDIKNISTNGKTISGTKNLQNHSNYQTNVTKISNNMGAEYIYFAHPNSASDPFGYTLKAKSMVTAMNSVI